MTQSEPRKLAVRSLSKRPAETLLLIIGISLGIGTTAGGIAMVANLKQKGNELLQSTEYREIVVSTRDSAEDMEVPAYRNEAESYVLLTGADLAAREIAPDIEHAYTADVRRVRIGNFGFFGNQQQPAVRAPGSEGTAQTSRGTSNAAPQPGADREAVATPADAPQEGEGPPAGGAPAQRGGFNFDIPEYSGPAPAIEEVDAMQVTPEYFDAYGIEPVEGSLFTQQEIDAQRPVAVVGSALSQVLFDDGVTLGREVLIFRTLYEIIGVAEPTGTELDEYIFYPSFTGGSGNEFTAALARFGGFGTALRFTVFDSNRLDEAQSQLQNHFDSTYGAGAVVVSTPGTEAKETVDRNSRLVSIILFLAVAGLFIAAVNVSNILYGRAMRKRKTIGVLKALGASRRMVFDLFLGEALTIGAIGALLGVGVSIGFTRLLGEGYASASIITLPLIAGALGGFAITLALTIIPALQASAIPAAEALRYE